MVRSAAGYGMVKVKSNRNKDTMMTVLDLG